MAVTRDAKSTAPTEDASAIISSTALTIGAHANLALIVQIIYSANPGVTTMLWGAQAMTRIGTANITSGRYVELWGLVNPTTGNQTINGTNANSVGWIVHGTSYYNVNQTGGATTFHDFTSATGTSTTVSVTITSTTGEMTVDVFAAGVGSATPNQTQLFFLSGAGDEDGGGSEAAGAATNTHTWTIANVAWVSAGMSIKEAGGGGANLSVSTIGEPVIGGSTF